jgi:hypothetical protein
MAKFIIQPHGRLNDWVAEEKGYFADEGLDYELNLDDGRANAPPAAALETAAEIDDILFGAYESYAEGHGRKGSGAGDVSCACHWTVNQAAKVEEGAMWGNAYSVADGAILVAGESDILGPEDLADRKVAVGYHSGSHYSALQALEVFLEPDRISLKFAGLPWARVDAALARKVDAVNVWGPQRYLLEQQGFRKVADSTFMMAFMFPREANEADVDRYMRALRRAQMDIDLEPERYKHYFLNEIPERFHDKVDARGFGVGERVVFLPYTKAMFEQTQAWMHERNLFEVGPEAGVSYEVAVRN